MQVGRCFVHMKIGTEHPQRRISPLKVLHIFIQHLYRKLSVLRFRSHVVLIPDLQDNLMEWFFLLAGTDFLIIIINPAVTSSLLLIVPGECFIKQFVIYVLNIFVAVFHVQTASFRVSILCMKFSAVMVDRAFSCHKADCSLQSISFLPVRVISAGYGA